MALNQLQKKGYEIWRSSIEKLIDPKATQIVSLSGGLDSRAILGALLDAGLKDKIVAITYGMPGSLDFDIAKVVARKMNVYHEVIDLTKIGLTQEMLEKTIEEGADWKYLFDAFYNHLIYKKFGNNAVYWNGFLGRTYTSSSQISSENESSWEAVCNKFIKQNSFSKAISLLHPEFEIADIFPKEPFLDINILSYGEQLNYLFRHPNIKPIVTSKKHICKLPFLDEDWVVFNLSIPNIYRRSQYLYKEILKTNYPKLFSLQTKSNYGLSLLSPKNSYYYKKLLYYFSFGARRLGLCTSTPKGVKPYLNYIDFSQGIRQRRDLKDIVYYNIQDLKKRGIVFWIDIDNIWHSHQIYKRNYAEALILLTTLEINLKVMEKQVSEN